MRGVIAFHVGVKTRQPQGRTSCVDESCHPAHLSQPSQRPVKREQRGRQTKAHHVGETVVLSTKRATGARHPRDSAIQAVENHRHQNGHSTRIKVALHASNNCVKAAEQSARRKEVGQ